MSNPFDRYSELDAILRQVLEAEPCEREALLQGLCADDPQLLDQAEYLLHQIEKNGSLDPVFRLTSQFLEETKIDSVLGSQLSHYQITDKLGEGGMGEVYRARDTRLGRDVAIKVLPAAFADDSERLSRFEREARVLATLNHPNIAQIYGFEHDGGIHFLVMELAEGETLADRLKRGPLPVDEAMAVAVQICRALEAAHERGIVHRDLKPANVNVSAETATGLRVKVLDFGLARAMSPTRDSEADLTHSPTLTQPTAAGTLLGTAAYMSPEQARGQQVDSRSDIWALGCVLFEMLTGQRAFTGNSVTDILAAVLKEQPDIDDLPTEISHAHRHLLSRCLSKDPLDRWHHAADVRLQLETSSAASISTPAQQRWALPLWALVSGGIALILLGSLLSLLENEDPPDPPATFRVKVDGPIAGHIHARFFSSVSVSSDGTRFAIAGRGATGGMIYVREASDSDWRALPDTEGGHAPKISPDGRWVTFSKDGYYRAPFSGGAITEIFGGEYSRWLDDTRQVAINEERLTIVDTSGTTQTLIDCGEGDTRCPKGSVLVIDEDKTIACIGARHSSEDDSLVMMTRDGATTPWLSDACYPRKAGERLFFRRKNEIWAVRISTSGAIDGQPIPTGISPYSANYQSDLHFDVSDTGVMIYLDSPRESELWRVDQSGRLLEKIPHSIPISQISHLRVSPDGKRASVVADREVRIFDLRYGHTSRAFGADNTAWLGDRSLSATLMRDETLNLLDENAQRLTHLPATLEEPKEIGIRVNAVDPETQTAILAVFGHPGASSGALMTLDLQKNEPLQLWWDQQGPDRFATLSPRGWLAWESRGARSMEINASPWQETARPLAVSTEGGEQARWSKDGRTLYFIDADRLHVMASTLQESGNAAFSTPKRLFRLPENAVHGQEVVYDTLGDSEFLFAIADRSLEYRLVINWFSEVDRLLDAAKK